SNVYTIERERRINIEEYRASEILREYALTFNFADLVYGLCESVWLREGQPGQEECECNVLQHTAPPRNRPTCLDVSQAANSVAIAKPHRPTRGFADCC